MSFLKIAEENKFQIIKLNVDFYNFVIFCLFVKSERPRRAQPEEINKIKLMIKFIASALFLDSDWMVRIESGISMKNLLWTIKCFISF